VVCPGGVDEHDLAVVGWDHFGSLAGLRKTIGRRVCIVSTWPVIRCGRHVFRLCALEV
jgi:hypothetical protein